MTDAGGFVHIWIAGSWTKERALEIHRPEGKWPATKVAFSPDGRLLAATSENMLKVFSAGDWREVAASANEQKIKDITFSPDSRWLIAIGESQQSDADAVSVIALDSRRTTSIMMAKEESRPAISVSPDDRWVANKADPHCVQRGSLVGDRRLVPGFVRVWEVASGKQVASLPLGMEFVQDKGPCPDPDPRDVDPLGAPSGNIELAKEARNWKTIPIETDRGLQQSPDRRWRASTDADSIILRHERGRDVALPHFDNVYDMAFTADGMSLVTTSADGTARVWALSREGMIRASCARLTSNFSKTDWRKYLPDEPYRAICPELPEERYRLNRNP